MTATIQMKAAITKTGVIAYGYIGKLDKVIRSVWW